MSQTEACRSQKSSPWVTLQLFLFCFFFLVFRIQRSAPCTFLQIFFLFFKFWTNFFFFASQTGLPFTSLLLECLQMELGQTKGAARNYLFATDLCGRDLFKNTRAVPCQGIRSQETEWGSELAAELKHSEIQTFENTPSLPVEPSAARRFCLLSSLDTASWVESQNCVLLMNMCISPVLQLHFCRYKFFSTICLSLYNPVIITQELLHFLFASFTTK